MTDELPAGWMGASIDEVAHVNPPGSATDVPDEQPVTFVPMAAVQALTGRIDLSTERPFGEVRKGFTRFRDGDVLFAKITPCMENGKITVARGLRNGVGSGSTEFHVLRSRGGVAPDYLRYFLLRASYRRDAERNMQGAVGQRRVPTEYLRQSRLPTPPLAEQHRIVSRIEELFSEIDEGERALERVQKLVERYRQSVLRAAVTGELTQANRKRSQCRYGSGEQLLDQILARRARENPRAPVAPTWMGSGLPEGWTWASVDQLCSSFSNGLSRKPAQQPPGVPILRISAVRPLAVDHEDVRYYPLTAGEQVERFLVHPGDILFTRYNGSRELVGVSGVFRGAESVLHPDKIIKARLADDALVLPDYFAIALNTGTTWAHLSSCVKTSAGQHGIAGADVKRAPVPLPPVEEQQRIVDVFNQVADRCQAILATTSGELRRTTALRQSILQAAFSGRLVPQDPTDEPASALLARLAAQPTDASPPARRKRSPRPSAA